MFGLGSLRCIPVARVLLSVSALLVASWSRIAHAQCEVTEDVVLLASDSDEHDHFGSSISVDGDVAVIAADNAEGCGAAYVYRLIDGQWVEEIKLTGGNDDVCDGFGGSVSISGQVVVVGAYNDNEACPGGSDCRSGAAYVYRKNDLKWIEEAKLIASDAEPQDRFGGSVAISGNVIVVGSREDDDADPEYPACDSGSAYVFRFDGTEWIEETKLRASDAECGDRFGSVGIEGEVAVVGATNANGTIPDNPQFNVGSAYVYRFDGEDWHEETRLIASDGESGDYFGFPVSLDGAVLVVGAPHENSNTGSLYVYRHDGASWNEEDKLTASDAELGDFFGAGACVKGDMLLAGAYGHNEGAAYIYQYEGNLGWTEEATLTASESASSPWPQFGRSVSANETVALIGAGHNDDYTGAAYVFTGFSDCNVNATVDLCEPDCNGSGRPDDCDINDGTSPDCNDNENPDECDVVSGFTVASEELSPISFGSPQSFTVVDPPPVMSDVLLTFSAIGDLEFPSQAIDIDVNGVYLGTVFIDANFCPSMPDVDELLVPQDVFAGAVGEGDAEINMVATSDVLPNLCFPSSFISVTVEYDTPGPSADINDNGVPDECECLSDLNGNGTVEISDLLALLADWGTDPGGPPDFDGDGNVGITDLLTLLGAWGPCT